MVSSQILSVFQAFNQFMNIALLFLMKDAMFLSIILHHVFESHMICCISLFGLMMYVLFGR
jgi:hypothetical protein